MIQPTRVERHKDIDAFLRWVARIPVEADRPRVTRMRLVEALSYSTACWIEMSNQTYLLECGCPGGTITASYWDHAGIRAVLAGYLSKPVIWRSA